MTTNDTHDQGNAADSVSEESATDELARVLEAEIAAIERSTTVTAWFGGGLAVIIAGYLMFLVIKVNQVVFNPQNLSEVAAQLVDEHLPPAITELEHGLRADAGPMAVRLVNTLRSTLPELRTEAEQRILFLKDATPAMHGTILQAIHEVTTAHREELRRTAELHTDKEFLNAFLTDLADELVTELENYLAQKYNEPALGKSFDRAAATLEEINGFVTALRTERTSDLTRREQLYRRTLATWFVLLSEAPKEG